MPFRSNVLQAICWRRPFRRKCATGRRFAFPLSPFCLRPSRMIDRLHHMETVAAIQEGMASAERGELKPATQVLDEMRAKYGLSRY